MAKGQLAVTHGMLPFCRGEGEAARSQTNA